jgi:opacity protein-like surface antigen
MKVWLCSAFILLSMTSLSFGEWQAGSQALTLLAGGGFSGSEYDQDVTGDPNKREKVADPGAAIGAQYLYFAKSEPTLGFGVEILKSALQEHASSDLLKDYNTWTRFQPTTFLALAKLAFGQGRINPYLFGGLGFHRTTFFWDLQPTDTVWPDTGTQERRRIIDDTGTGFAGAAGMGVDIFLTRSFFVGAEARGTYLGKAGYSTTAQAADVGLTGEARGDFLTFNLLGRIGLRFGA